MKALIPVLALVAGVAFVVKLTIDHQNGQRAVVELDTSEHYRDLERLAQKDRQRIEDAKNAEIRAIDSQLVDAIGLLQNRADRAVSTAPRAACAGGTGAELSKPDATFLTGEAARANRLRAELQACQDREWQTYERYSR